MKKRVFMTVTGGAAFLAFILFIIFLLAPWDKSEKNGGNPSSGGEFFLIATEDGGKDLYTAQLISASLSQKEFNVILEKGDADSKELFSRADDKDCLCVITVGEEVTAAYSAKGKSAPGVFCLTDDPGEPFRQSADGDMGIIPRLSSSVFANAALALVPDARHFTLISNAVGACDVQDACDVLDLCGTDYTVETLENRPYGKAVFSAAYKGTDVVILPSGDFSCGGIDLAEYGAAVIALGDGEPVKGALGSFCANTEAIAADTVNLALAAAGTGEFKKDGEACYYNLCISQRVAAELGIDISSVEVDIPVVIVD